MVSDFYNYTKKSIDLVSEAPKTIEEMQSDLNIYDRLKNEIDPWEINLAELKEYFGVLEKNYVPIDENMKEMVENLNDQWKWYLNKLKNVQEVLETSKIALS